MSWGLAKKRVLLNESLEQAECHFVYVHDNLLIFNWDYIISCEPLAVRYKSECFFFHTIYFQQLFHEATVISLLETILYHKVNSKVFKLYLIGRVV